MGQTNIPGNRVFFLVSVLAFFFGLASEVRAGAWVIGAKRIQAKLSFFQHSTAEEFILNTRFIGANVYEPGSELPYAFDGESISRAYLLSLRGGLSSNLEFGIRFSYYDLQFNDDGGKRRSKGSGDLYFETIFVVMKQPIAVSARMGAKAPTARFDIDAEQVPLGENQWDVEGAIAVGKSLYPLPVYVSLEGGYRYRFENRVTRVKPGNEIFFLFEAGASPREWVFIKVAFDGLVSSARESREFGFLARNLEGRKVLGLSPFFTLYPSRRIFIETGARILLAGRDYPAGVQYLASLGWRIK